MSPEKVMSLRFAHKSYIHNGKVILGYVKDICEDAKCVVVNGEKVCKKKKNQTYVLSSITAD